MKQDSLRRIAALTGLALCLLAAQSWATRHRGRPGLPTSAAASDPAVLLAVTPLATRPSASDQAIAKWTEKTKGNVGDDGAWVNLGDALMQKARETMDLGYYGYAERAYRKALALNPNKTSALIGLAWVNGGRHEFEKSIEWANKALALDPQSNDAYGLIGDADVEMGNYDAAYEHYQKMLDIRPDLSSYSRGAHLLYLTGSTRRAAWLMLKAVDTGGPYAENTAWCRAQLALILFSDGNLLAAEAALQDAVKKTPNNYYVLAAMGKVKAARKDYPAAIGYYKKAVAVVPQHDAVVALGDLYALTGDKAEAEKQYALVETIHALQKANGVRGGWQLAQFDADHDRNLPAALAMVQEEYKTRPNVYVADTLAWCLYKNRRYAEASEMSKKALSKRTLEAGFFFHAGMISARLGIRSSAQEYLYQAVSLNPNFSPLSAPVSYATLKQLGSKPPDAKPVAAR
jgi:tetratricopeptide (TPR) repeat protein